jgi:hypothetical protein
VTIVIGRGADDGEVRNVTMLTYIEAAELRAQLNALQP